MAVAYVEFCGVTRTFTQAVIAGDCYYQEALTISGSTATTASAVSISMMGTGDILARVQNDGTACYLATGSTPDPTATTATGSTSIRRYVSAGAEAFFVLRVGDKVAVRAVA